MKMIFFGVFFYKYFPSGSEGVRMTISGGGVGGVEPKKISGWLSLAMTPPATHF